MTGVIIARFQTPYLHPGHQALITSVQSNHKRVVIVLGVSPVLGSQRNPLDFHTREKMIRTAYPDVVVLPLPDQSSDTVWSANLDNLLQNTFPGTGFMLYGSRESFIAYYHGKCPVQELPAHGEFSATEIRKGIKDQVMGDMEFRAGIIYAYANTYPKVYPTVDVAVFRNDRKEILLGRKQHENQWRLIGGFTDPADDAFEHAAKRELQEECGAIEVGEMQYEGSFKVNDWRYKNEIDKIITTLFSTDYLAGEPQGSDDIAEVRWFPMRTLPEMIEKQRTVATHSILFNALLKRYA